jgi:hypothetical protein
MEGGVPKGLHLHGRPTLEGEESQVDSPYGGRPPSHMEGGNPTPSGIPTLGRFPYHMEGFGFGSYSETCSPTLGASTYIMRDKGRGPATPTTTKVAAPLVAGAPLSQTLAALSPPPHPARLAKLRRISPPPPTPRRRAVGFKRSYYFRCPLERGGGRRLHQQPNV